MAYRDIVGKGLTVSNAVKPAKNTKTKSKRVTLTFDELKEILNKK